MFLSTIASVISIGAGINSIVQSNRDQQGGGGATDDAARAADPFGPFRSQYAQELGVAYNDLNRFDPNAIKQDPAYQFQLEQGLGAIDKGAAAAGMLGSGTRLLDLEKFGSGLASNFADRQFQRKMSILQMLGGFSGATTGSPAAAANAITAGNANAQNGLNNGLGNVMSGLGGLSRTNWSGGGGYGGTTDGGGGMIWNNSGYGP